MPSEDDKLLELYDRPLSGPMVEIFARLDEEARIAREELEARQRIEQAAREAAQRLERERRDREVSEALALYSEQRAATKKPVRYRLRIGGGALCQRHGDELRARQFVEEIELIPVWDDETIERIATQTGQFVQDVTALHGEFSFEECIMCGVHPADNACLHCQRVLPPQWPAVYCTTRCAHMDV